MSFISSSDSKLNNLKDQYIRKEHIEFRQYQVEIAKKCVNHNSLVVLPTGLGKTIIAILVAAYTLELYPEKSKIIILAPTRPLINQQYESFKNFLTLSEESFTILTGRVNPEERSQLFHEHQIILYTPQTLRNDLVKKRYSLDTTCLIVFDEAHHASGDYPYPLIADEYLDQNPDGNILGLTASPGASKTKIKTLCELLHIPLTNIHTRIRTDRDVKSYIKPMNIFKVGVNLTTLMKDACLVIQQLLEERLQYLSSLGFLERKTDRLIEKVFRNDLLKLNSELISLVNSNGDKTGVYSALSVNAQALILFHMVDLIEQQGLDILLTYLLKVKEDAKKQNSSKAIKILGSDLRLHQVVLELLKHYEHSPERLIHPKYKVLEKIILNQLKAIPDSRILVFVKFRDSVKNITIKLNKEEFIAASRFVGQSTKSKDDKGLTQKKQLEILDEFKQGKYNVLVSTNVGEEGLDITECDLVIFYDVVVSEIRFIQRKGRTARQRKGEVIILYCVGTHDDIYLRIVMNKLKRMNIELKTQEKTFDGDKEISEPTFQINNIQKNKKGLLKFVSNAIKEMPKPELVKLNINLPVKFGLRKKLQREGIDYTLNNQSEHIVIHGKVLIQIFPIDSFTESLQDKITKFITAYQHKFQLIIIILDFINFQEGINGELRVIKQKARQIAEEKHYKIIPIEDEEELWFILRSILDQNLKKG